MWCFHRISNAHSLRTWNYTIEYHSNRQEKTIFVYYCYYYAQTFYNFLKKSPKMRRDRKNDESVRKAEEKVELPAFALQLKNKVHRKQLNWLGYYSPIALSMLQCLLKTNYFLFAMIILTRNLDKSTYFHVFFYFYVNLLDYPTML